MLRALDIRDILLIDRLNLEFQPGLNVLTGETGAGKSILLDSLGFVLGWRGRAELVRAGADQGEVVAVFDLPSDHPGLAVLSEAGIETDGEVILRRVNTRDGRKTAWINDRRVSGEVLRALSETLVELHGQHDDRGLLNARGHRALLDAYGKIDTSAARTAWGATRTAVAALEKAEAEAEALRSEEDFLRHAVSELDALDPQPGEDATLDQQRRMMQAAERVREDIAKAAQALGDQGADAMMNDALRWLDGAAEAAEGQLDAPLEALARARDALSEAEQGVADALDRMTFDAFELERTEERLFALRGLARKHSVQPDDLGAFANDLRTRLEALDGAAGNLDALRTTVTAAQTAYATAADKVTAKRQKAAKSLAKAMAQELAPLKMERAQFSVAVEPGDPGPDGQDIVRFEVATNPGAPAGELGKIASGGELSRFLLALKVCLTGDDAQQTMIFDEIDRGVGGATADAVGRRLADLASGGQVLVVTHAPQVAALAGHHWRVAKRQTKDATLSEVTPLTPDERIDEIARMLAGDKITDAARAAARELIGATA